MAGRVAVFAPSPVLTVTVEDHGSGADVHVHAGGQGLWQARMLQTLGAEVVVVAALVGETGAVVGHLCDDEGVPLLSVRREGRGAAYLHDRRDGERDELVETPGDALSRHDLDELYGLALRAGLESDVTVLSGPAGDDTLPVDVYRRLAADLRAVDRVVVADLAGDRLEAVLEGGVDVLKVSDQELLADELIAESTPEQIVEAMRDLRLRGASSVVVTCSDLPTFVLDGPGARVFEVSVPAMQVVDTRGAGDSLTAGVAAVLAAGGGLEEAVVTGTAAGALNVTRHGLGSGDPDAIAALRAAVSVRDL